MKFWKRILASLTIASIAIMYFATIVLAFPGPIVFRNGNPSDTSVILYWAKASSSTQTVILYRKDIFPTLPTDPLGTLSYNGTASECTVLGLTAGTTYYFSAWGYDSATLTYSLAPANCVVTTSAIAPPSGAPATSTAIVPIPTIPSSANATANITAFNLEPFTSMILFFVTGNTTGGSGVATGGGGLGMPANNFWEVLAIGAIVVGGIGTYVRMKNFFIAYFVVFILTCFFVGLHLVQIYLPAIELVIGAGVWALERYFQ